MTRMDLGRKFSRGRVAFRSRSAGSATRSAISIISNLPLEDVARLSMTPLRVSLQWSWYLVSLMADVSLIMGLDRKAAGGVPKK